MKLLCLCGAIGTGSITPRWLMLRRRPKDGREASMSMMGYTGGRNLGGTMAASYFRALTPAAALPPLWPHVSGRRDLA